MYIVRAVSPLNAFSPLISILQFYKNHALPSGLDLRAILTPPKNLLIQIPKCLSTEKYMSLIITTTSHPDLDRELELDLDLGPCSHLPVPIINLLVLVLSKASTSLARTQAS